MKRIKKKPTIFLTVGKPLFWAVLYIVTGISFVCRFFNKIGNPLFSIFPKKKRTSVLLFSRKKAVQKKKKKSLAHIARFYFLRSASFKKLADRMHNILYSRFMSYVGRLWVPLATLCLVILGTAHIALTINEYILTDLPTPQDLRRHTPSLTTRIYDRNGILLYSFFKDENRSLIKLSDLPPHVINAFVSIEDKEFFQHHGVSARGLVRAFRSVVELNKMQGGSTITQQLVKNTLLSNERTFVRKAKEMIIALRVEREFTKQEILEMYLNEVSFGGSLYGIEEASKSYFGKRAKDLSIAESSYLAGLPAAPSIYSPFGESPEQGIVRQGEVLRRMREDGKISPEEYELVKGTQLSFHPTPISIKAPHFVMYIREKLIDEFGEASLSQGGLEITTTLDLSVQEQAQKLLSDEVATLQKLRISNGAALVTNPKTGEIIAMVGSKDYFDTKNDGQVNVTTRQRQPGSSIKPLMYAAALERGFTPSSLLDDSPITIPIIGGKPYSPKNYDGRFHGKMTLRTALASSYNIPAVKTEMSIGLSTFIEKARALGISTWENSRRFGPALTLGGGEVLMTDMATAYSTFANNGITVPLQGIKEIKDSSGKTLVRNPCIQTPHPCGGQQTIDPRIAYQITSILSDNTARSPAFGTQSVLTIPGQEVSVKTGTTNGLRDNWTIGYTSNHVVAVWVGNNDNSQMSRVTSGIIGASPIWAKIMKLFLPQATAHTFPVPDGLVKATLCSGSKLLSCGGCASSYTEYFLPGTEPPSECSVLAQSKDKEEKNRRQERHL